MDHDKLKEASHLGARPRDFAIELGAGVKSLSTVVNKRWSDEVEEESEDQPSEEFPSSL